MEPTSILLCKTGASYKGTTERLEYKKDRFVVKTEAGWEYWLARVVNPEPEKFTAFEKTPPVYADGYMAYNKRFYPVSKRDIVRGHFLNKQEYSYTLAQLISAYEDPRSEEETSTTSQLTDDSPGSADSSERNSNERELGGVTKEEIDELDMARDEYLRTLHLLQDSEEEWDF